MCVCVQLLPLLSEPLALRALAYNTIDMFHQALADVEAVQARAIAAGRQKLAEAPTPPRRAAFSRRGDLLRRSAVVFYRRAARRRDDATLDRRSTRQN